MTLRFRRDSASDSAQSSKHYLFFTESLSHSLITENEQKENLLLKGKQP
jgi:hypothetical protein